MSADTNETAKRFYAGQGAAPDAGWEHWTLPIARRI